MKYPLFGIIYNWKGLKEENYLYTAEELKQFDEKLYEDCMNGHTNEWFDSTKSECAWKTWMGFKITEERFLKRFLAGMYNETERMDEDDDWYWENVEDNDLYGYPSNTMREALSERRGRGWYGKD